MPEGCDPYAWQFERGAADLFLTYCASAVLARAADPALRQVALPETLSVPAEYGKVLLSDRLEAARVVLFQLSPAGRSSPGTASRPPAYRGRLNLDPPALRSSAQ